MGRGCLRVGIGPHTKRLRDKETTKRRRDEATKRRRGDGYVHDRAADWSLATPAKVRAEAMKKGHRGLTTWRRQRMSGERVHGVHTPDPSSRLLETPREGRQRRPGWFGCERSEWMDKTTNGGGPGAETEHYRVIRL
jgi:hypothetical protein